MAQAPANKTGAGGASSASPVQYYDLSAPLTPPVTTLQVSSFTLHEGMRPSLTMPDGSLYFGPTTIDGKYRIPSGCGIILFHQDEAAQQNFVMANAALPGPAPDSGGGLVSYFFGRGVPKDGNGSGGPGSSGGSGTALATGHAGAAFLALCKRYQQGDRYGGDWVDGVFHGDGALLTSYFSYQGGWKEARMHGRGTISYTRKYVDARPAAAHGGANANSAGVGTLLLKGLSYVTPFELVSSAPAPKEYIGEFDAAHGRQGTGLMRYYNGDVYDGEWMDNCRHGRGKLLKLDGEVYEGDWVYDVRHGYGKILYPNGSLFKGSMRQDKRDGEGVMRFANGDEYFGNFLKDHIEGNGTMRYRNGDVYEGAWHDQLRHGHGKYTLKRTGATMNGLFQSGLIHGEGVVVVPGVSTFVGVFVRGERTVGTMHWHHWQQHQPSAAESIGKDGGSGSTEALPVPSPSADVPLRDAAQSTATNPITALNTTTTTTTAAAPTTTGVLSKATVPKNYLCYQGEWHGEHMHGKGLLWYTNGDFYAGRFRKSERHGAGNMRYAAEQAEYSGTFVHGVRHGLGLLQRADGSIRAGRWQGNVFVEGYEGEWNGTVFHGIGRLTIPLDTFFGLRASNSTLKFADVSAMLSDTSNPPAPPSGTVGALTDADGGGSGSASDNRGCGSPAAAGASAGDGATTGSAFVMSDALKRAELSPLFIDFFGLFQNGLRDGLGMLKLPALDGVVGGALNLAEVRKANNHNNSNRYAGGSSTGGTGSGPITLNPTSKASFGKSPLVTDATAGAPAMVVKGRWVREVLHCEKGVLAFPNGVVYVGGFRNGARDASRAHLWWPDGSVLECGWRRDAPSGSGVWYRRNRLDPMYQTMLPSALRQSRSRRRTTAAKKSSSSSPTNSSPSTSPTGGAVTSVTNLAGDLLGLSYLWGLIGSGFMGGGTEGGNRTENAPDTDDLEAEEEPQRVLIDYQNHFAVSCTWYPYALDLSAYTSVVLPQVVEQTKPLANGVPWPQVFHSASMSTAMGNPGFFNGSAVAASSFFQNNTNNANNTNTAATVPSVKQITACATSLNLPAAPAALPVGRASGPAVVHFETGIVLAAEWLSNTPRLAVPYRPWSAYDGFLVWQASRPAARNCAAVFPVWVTPRSQSCYASLCAMAPDDVRGEPRRAATLTTTAEAYGLMTAFSPLAKSGGAAGGSESGAATSSAVSPSPNTKCTVCGREYSFFRKRTHCTLCLRSTCYSCLGSMDTDGHHQEDVRALLRHAYATSEQTVQLAAAAAVAAAAANKNNKSNDANNSNATRRVTFPSIPVEHVERVFDRKNMASVPVCADCVRTVLWKLRYTQLWIPMSIFASVLDMERHQRDEQMRRRAPAPEDSTAATATATATTSNDEEEGPETRAAALGGSAEASANPLAADPYSRESSRCHSVNSESLPVVAETHTPRARLASLPDAASAALSNVVAADVVADAVEKAAGSPETLSTPTAPPQLKPTSEESGEEKDGGDVTDSPSASPAHATAEDEEEQNTHTRRPTESAFRQDARRPSAELLAPAQYITYCGYTSHSIPHVYGELWWGRRYYYRGGFCAGERHGFGVQYMPNGERYEGAFQRDAWHGPGVYYLDDGSVLLGEFQRGTLAIVQYHGEVEEDTVHGVRPHGRGVGYDLDGSVYNGEWMHGQRQGTGMLHLADGASVYSGTFVGNAMEGMGKLVTTSGAYYGDFRQNQQHGKGLLFTANCVVEGHWVHGVSNGFTRIYERASGEVYETTYRDGNERDDCFTAPMMLDDDEAAACGQCGTTFSFFLRRHHCRLCGDVFCDACTQHRASLPANFSGEADAANGGTNSNNNTNSSSDGSASNANVVNQRVCDACFFRLTQRRMLGVRRYKDGSVYAGCWSQGRWVSRGLYCRPDGIFIVMDTHGCPLMAADLAKAKQLAATSSSAMADASGAAASTEDGKETATSTMEKNPKKRSTPVPAGGLGVHPRNSRSALPVSPSLLQDASPAKEVLDNAAVIAESSSRAVLDAFLMWWATARSRCGLQVPLSVALVSKYQRMPATLLRGGQNATVRVGSEGATYLSCPTRCALSVPHTPSLTPIHLFVTLAESRRAMQSMVEGEVGSGSFAAGAAADRETAEARALPAARVDSDTEREDEARGEAMEDTAADPTAVATATSFFSSSSSPTSLAASASRITTEELRTIDSDVEAAALRASRFMPVAIPRAPTIPITGAVMPIPAAASVSGPSTSVARAMSRSPSNTSPLRDRVSASATPKKVDGGGSAPHGTAPAHVGAAGRSATAGASPHRDGYDSAVLGMSAWTTRPPPTIDSEDITDEALVQMMQEERRTWPKAINVLLAEDTATKAEHANKAANADGTASTLAPENLAVAPLMPPTPLPPPIGVNAAVLWDTWTTKDVPRYVPPPLTSVIDTEHENATSAASTPTNASEAALQPMSEADMYFACPFWEPTVPDVQALLEQGKMTQAARLMRRLQRQHQIAEAGSSAGDIDDAVEDLQDDVNFVGRCGSEAGHASGSSSPGAVGTAAKSKKAFGAGRDALDVLQQTQAAAVTASSGSASANPNAWSAGGLLAAEQRAQSGGGWAPAPMHGPFTFAISSSEKKRSADGQEWYAKVTQQELPYV